MESTSDEPLLFIKYDQNKLNILGADKKTLTLKSPIQIEPKSTNLCS